MTIPGFGRRSVDKSLVLHFAAAGALIFGVDFVSYWLLAFGPVTTTHASFALFPTAETASASALVQALGWSLVFGAWLGIPTAAVRSVLSRPASDVLT